MTEKNDPQQFENDPPVLKNPDQSYSSRFLIWRDKLIEDFKKRAPASRP